VNYRVNRDNIATEGRCGACDGHGGKIDPLVVPCAHCSGTGVEPGFCRCGRLLFERKGYGSDGVTRSEMVCTSCENDRLTRLARSAGR
jgi:hypothetical protein